MRGAWWVALSLLAAPPASWASTDLLDLLGPAHPDHVLAAGLDLPGSTAPAPDAMQPLSLLQHPSSLTLQARFSRPLLQTGPTRSWLGGPHASTLVHYRHGDGDRVVALGASYRSQGVSLHESGAEWTHGTLSAPQECAGAAWRQGRAALGIGVQRDQQSGYIDSTQLLSLETEPGLGRGRIDWRGRYRSAVLEGERERGHTAIGGLARWSAGDFTAWSWVDGQGYSAGVRTRSVLFAPYVAWRRSDTLRLGRLAVANGSVAGPVYVGNVSAGQTSGETTAYSIAWVRQARRGNASEMLSVEASGLEARFRGAAGGFVLPGLFSSPVATDNWLSWHQVAARYGRERRAGAWAFRASAMLAYGMVDGRLYATQARWLQPLRELCDVRLDHAGLWVFSPAAGIGYERGGWRLDAGAALTAAVLVRRRGAPQPAQEGGWRPRSRLRPAYRWGISVSRAL